MYEVRWHDSSVVGGNPEASGQGLMSASLKQSAIPWAAALAVVSFFAGLGVSLLGSEPPPRHVVSIPLTQVAPDAGPDVTEELEREIEALKEDLTTTRRRAESVAKELATAQESAETAAQDLTEAKEALDSAEIEIAEAADRNRIFNDELTEMRSDITGLRETRDELNARIGELERENRRLEQELQRARSAPSFLSSPLSEEDR